MPVTYTEKADRIDVGYVAHLARLELSPAERDEFQAQLEEVLTYVRQLSEVEVGDVEPLTHPVDRAGELRPDETRPGMDRALALANAPASRGGHVMVPRIME